MSAPGNLQSQDRDRALLARHTPQLSTSVDTLRSLLLLPVRSILLRAPAFRDTLKYLAKDHRLTVVHIGLVIHLHRRRSLIDNDICNVVALQ